MMKTKRFRVLVTFLFLSSLPLLISAQAPPLINYQGRLTNEQAQPVPNGTRNLTFNIYDSATAGIVIWGPQSFTNVPVINGYFNVILGEFDEISRSITEAFSDPDRYLSVSINGEPEVLPRQRVLSTPYALNAGGNILKGFDESNLTPVDIGRVVEKQAMSTQLRLSYDEEGFEGARLRGVYIGNGRIQISGILTLSQSLEIGKEYYLTNDDQNKGSLVTYSSPPDRLLVTLIGVAASEHQLQLDIRAVTTSDSSSPAFPKGAIIMWSGTIETIPTGWKLCDGQEGRPDLRDKFIFGAGNLAAPHDNRKHGVFSETGSSIKYIIQTSSGGSGDPKFAGQDTPHQHDVMPPYYALAFIIKVK